MKLIKPSYEIKSHLDSILQIVEAAGRCCYKSEAKIGPETSGPFCKMLIDRGHESVIEHASITVKFTVDRGVSHELVRHRLCSFSQESTRYCDYAPSGKAAGITFVIPPWVNIEEGEYNGDRYTGVNKIGFAECQWFAAMANAEAWYNHLREAGWRPEQARSVLPNSLKTEIVVTANLREWRHIQALRTAPAAHPQMREMMVPLFQELHAAFPVVFRESAV